MAVNSVFGLCLMKSLSFSLTLVARNDILSPFQLHLTSGATHSGEYNDVNLSSTETLDLIPLFLSSTLINYPN